MNEGMTEIPYLENIGIFLTYKCQVACPHCVVQAGPNRTEVMEEERLRDWISQAAEYGGRMRSINFTGGEPFYDLRLFRAMCRFTVSKGLFPTSVTNGLLGRNV
jgi:MoaA/NifB/PqqE/SkfB family radical SAM enzyme